MCVLGGNACIWVACCQVREWDRGPARRMPENGAFCKEQQDMLPGIAPKL